MQRPTSDFLAVSFWTSFGSRVCAVGAAGSEREEEEEGAGCQAALGRREGGARHLRAQEVVDPVDLRREIQLELLIVEHEHAA